MNAGFFTFGQLDWQAGSATHPLARLAKRRPLSLVVAGNRLPPPRFAAATRPDAPSGASNHGF